MFQKLGGTAAIQGVVDEFYTRVFADDEVKGFFEGIDKRKLKAHQVETPTRGLQAIACSSYIPALSLVSASHNPSKLPCLFCVKGHDGKHSYESVPFGCWLVHTVAVPITRKYDTCLVQPLRDC